MDGLVCPLEVSVSSGSIQVARGQTAVLPCTFTTNAALTNLNVIWMVIPLSNANQPQQVILYQGGQIFGGAPQFYGRVGFAVTMPTTSASIFINNTQLSDTGTYQCLVNNLPDRGIRNIGVIGLTVLVPPSVPLCRIQGSLDVGSDITLTCSSEEGIPRPTYLWEKLDNVPRLPPTATQDQVQGTVTLRNISTVSSGLYQCVASNAIGTSTCLLDLQVIAPHPRSIGLIAGAVATGAVVLVVCIVLVAVALFYWKNKHKEEEEEEIPNEIREDDLPPKCSSAAKTFHADASSSENDTLTSSNTYNSRYWNDPKANHATDSFTRFSNSNDAHQPPFSRSGSTSARPVYANGGHPSPAPPKTLVVTASTAPPVTQSSHPVCFPGYPVAYLPNRVAFAAPPVIPPVAHWPGKVGYFWESRRGALGLLSAERLHIVIPRCRQIWVTKIAFFGGSTVTSSGGMKNYSDSRSPAQFACVAAPPYELLRWLSPLVILQRIKCSAP
ncbi:PREDICTED: immunoglobulin superfamily member 11 [Corvus brachyrhynchos]|uniref:immunoglobulin superfamily member 11 n=1 Tax=Corvus brachyrhynchos TaxID=85066 RepID=UPI00081656C9|nr:PREDICTED: immunoglobulin superfamily member 11 [Corvus brachyrhynchos]